MIPRIPGRKPAGDFSLNRGQTEGKKMARMAKIPRGYTKEGIYYVTSRGDNERDIFKDPEDYKIYIDVLKKYKAQYGFELFSFILMPKHLHLLVGLKEDTTISDIMHDLNANYTKYFNARYNRKGHLFQERTKINLVEKTTYLADLVSYIHLNPKVAGLVTDLGDYPYSSYHLYTGKTVNWNTAPPDISAETRQVLSFTAGRPYADYLAGVNPEKMRAMTDLLRKNTILGSEEFINKIKAAVQTQQARTSAPAPVATGKFLLAAAAAVVALLVLAAGVYFRSAYIRNRLNEALANRESELNAMVAKERSKIYKDLDEKYRADRVSSQALAKRLEIEKQKTEELKKKLGEM